MMSYHHNEEVGRRFQLIFFSQNFYIADIASYVFQRNLLVLRNLIILFFLLLVSHFYDKSTSYFITSSRLYKSSTLKACGVVWRGKIQLHFEIENSNQLFNIQFLIFQGTPFFNFIIFHIAVVVHICERERLLPFLHNAA